MSLFRDHRHLRSVSIQKSIRVPFTSSVTAQGLVAEVVCSLTVPMNVSLGSSCWVVSCDCTTQQTDTLPGSGPSSCTSYTLPPLRGNANDHGQGFYHTCSIWSYSLRCASTVLTAQSPILSVPHSQVCPFAYFRL